MLVSIYLIKAASLHFYFSIDWDNNTVLKGPVAQYLDIHIEKETSERTIEYGTNLSGVVFVPPWKQKLWYHWKEGASVNYD